MRCRSACRPGCGSGVRREWKKRRLWRRRATLLKVRPVGLTAEVVVGKGCDVNLASTEVFLRTILCRCRHRKQNAKQSTSAQLDLHSTLPAPKGAVHFSENQF